MDKIFNSHNDQASAPRVEPSAPRVDAPTPRVEPPKAQGPASNTRAAARKQAAEHCAQVLRDKLNPQLFPDAKGRVPFQALHKLVHSVMDLETGKMLNYKDLLKHPKLGPDWQVSGANEFGRLAQGVGGRIKGTNTIKFIQKEDVPLDRQGDATYASFVCNV